MPETEFIDWSYSITPFSDFLALQGTMRREAAERPDTPMRVLFMQHPPTVSFGSVVPIERQLLSLRVPGDVLHKRNVHVARIARGGGAAVHGPGILGCYVIARVGKELGNLPPLVRRIVRWTWCALAGLGIPVWQLDDKLRTDRARRDKYAGLWIGNRKIASVGVGASAGVSTFGININVNPERWLLDLVHPCGITEYRMSSLHHEGYRVTREELVARLKTHA